MTLHMKTQERIQPTVIIVIYKWDRLYSG